MTPVDPTDRTPRRSTNEATLAAKELVGPKRRIGHKKRGRTTTKGAAAKNMLTRLYDIADLDKYQRAAPLRFLNDQRLEKKQSLITVSRISGVDKRRQDRQKAAQKQREKEEQEKADRFRTVG